MFTSTERTAPPSGGRCLWAIRGAQARTSREFGKEEVRQRNVDNSASLRQSPALNFYPYLTMPLSAQIVFGAEGELDDTDAIAVVRKEIKKRQDSVASYETANRADLADVEKAEIAVLEKYLPAAMSAEDLVKLVETVIAELGATSKKEMGNVMKVLQARSEGRADSRTLSTEVAKRLV
jgi:uncharacterized protein